MKPLLILIALGLASCSYDRGDGGIESTSRPVSYQRIDTPNMVFKRPMDIASFFAGKFPEGVEGGQRLYTKLLRDPNDPRAMLLTITADGGVDDSINGEETQARITTVEGGWSVLSAGRRWKCGRGPDVGKWGARLCP